MYKKRLELRYFEKHENLYESLSTLFSAFRESDKELYIVGGCVRDILLEKEPKDFDLCTNAKPQEVKVLLDSTRYHTIDTGIKHGTLTIIDTRNHLTFEITTYRCDGLYKDARHPETVTFVNSLEEDLKRRDFTINSFAYDLHNKELLMLDESFEKDLEHGIVRAIGDPVERYEEDALRMLRALRFSAQLNFSIAKDTYHAIDKCNFLLHFISKERIRDEITKILLSDNPQVLELFVILGLEQYAFDGKTPIKDILMCEHQNPWHYSDVFHHTMDVIKRVPKTFVLRWSALFHDMGKPMVKNLKEGTTSHYNYHGHQDVSCSIAMGIMELLKFSNYDKDLIYKFVKYHDANLVEYRNSRFKNVLVDIGVNNFKDYMQLRKSDAFAHRLAQSTKYAIDYLDDIWERFNRTILKNEALTLKDLKINGYDLMNLGLKNKSIGDMLKYLLERVLEDDSLNEKEKLLTLTKEKLDEMQK